MAISKLTKSIVGAAKVTGKDYELRDTFVLRSVKRLHDRDRAESASPQYRDQGHWYDIRGDQRERDRCRAQQERGPGECSQGSWLSMEGMCLHRASPIERTSPSRLRYI